MTFSVLVAIAATVWLTSCVASLLSLYWCQVAGPTRRVAALVSSCAATLIALLGLARIRVAASQTTNGQVVWSLNSRWFFLAALVLALTALAVALWRWQTTRSASASAPVITDAQEQG